jgi:hypothetical protein
MEELTIINIIIIEFQAIQWHCYLIIILYYILIFNYYVGLYKVILQSVRFVLAESMEDYNTTRRY